MRKNRINILFITNDFYPHYRSEITELFEYELANRGYSIHYLSFTRDSKDLQIHHKNNNHYYIMPIRPITPYHTINKKFKLSKISTLIRKIVKGKQIEIIQVRDCPDQGRIAYNIAKELNIPFCYYLTSNFTEFNKQAFRFQKNLATFYLYISGHINDHRYRSLISKSDLFEACTSSLIKCYADEIPKEKTLVLPMCPPKVFFESSRISISNNMNLIYIGQISHTRNPFFLINVIHKVKKEIPNVSLTFVGPFIGRQLKVKMQKRIKKLNVESNIVIMDPIEKNQIPELLSNYSVGVSPLPPVSCFIMSSPTKVLEYLSVGLPAICNKEINDQDEVVRKSGGGYSIPYNEEDFARVLIKMLKDRETLAKMGRNGRHWVSKNRTYERLTDQLESHYRKLLS